jgi:hypothetical protein
LTPSNVDSDHLEKLNELLVTLLLVLFDTRLTV